VRPLCITPSVRFPKNRNKVGTNVSLSPADLCYPHGTHPLHRDPLRVKMHLNNDNTDKLVAAITLAPAILVSTANDINDNKLPNGGAALPPQPPQPPLPT
jgi:hypothetical protein